MKGLGIVLLGAALIVFCAGRSWAEKSQEKAILIVAFGTSVEKARVSYAAVEEQVRKAFPDRRIDWAWSARSLLGTTPARMLSTQQALAKLGVDGTEEVLVLSLHIIPGSEYHDLIQTVKAFEGLPKGLKEIRLGPPLLHDTDSLKAAAAVLIKNAPKDRKPGDALLFAGHGTHHPAGVYYPALQHYLSALDKNAFVATIEGDPDFEEARAAMKGAGVKKVWLSPLMTVAGDHSRNDLFGPEAESWKRRLEADGFTVECVVKGLGEDPDLISLWIKGLKDASAPDKSRKVSP
ncbi:MAG: sirohydrochlorin cobaltochelatase [Desulfovibrio sp.]|jgi:sirohydrochlorin cobaltochelatase|nr:sirohydrochlorin cobaltochelatase [Desulfovibrio sp.]